jgi:DNA-binding MarR family transcriptional regulator
MTAVPPPPAELPARVWSALQAFVDAQDRRAELREALGLGRGTGRVTVLLALTRGPMTLRDIAEANGVDAPYATVIVDKLESRGLVQRTAHPDDNRRKLVVLTDAGRDAAALAGRILAEPPAALASLPAGDLACLDEILTRLRPPDQIPPDLIPPGSAGPGGPADLPPTAATS